MEKFRVYSETDKYYDDARLERSRREAEEKGMGADIEQGPLLTREERSEIAIKEALKRQEAEADRKKRIEEIKQELKNK